jgi:hypothetical protein
MKKVLVLVATTLAAVPAFAADVGITVGIGDPNFYGHIVIGNAPPPVLVYSEPIVIVRQQVVLAPVYLRVRPGHAQNWSRYCGRYDACGRQVYFVQDTYYQEVYAPHYQKHHGHGKGKGNGNKGNGNKG